MKKWIETWINNWDHRMFRALVNYQTSLWAFEDWCKNRGTSAANLTDFNTNTVKATRSFIRDSVLSLIQFFLLWQFWTPMEPQDIFEILWFCFTLSFGFIFAVCAFRYLIKALVSRASTRSLFAEFWEDNTNLTSLLELSHINARAVFLNQASKVIVFCAGRVLEMEHEHGTDSDQAAVARERLNKHHKLLVRFELINRDRTEYFTEAKIRRVSGPGIDLNYLRQGVDEADAAAEPPKAATLDG
jgi:hypothetical protein